MITEKSSRILLICILLVLVLILLKPYTPINSISYAQEIRSELSSNGKISFAVTTSGIFIMDLENKKLYKYDQRGRINQVFEMNKLGENFKVSR